MKFYACRESPARGWRTLLPGGAGTVPAGSTVYWINLSTDQMQTYDVIFTTIKVGINSANKDSRTSQMPAFGRDQMLPRADVLKVASFVYSLSHPEAKNLDPKIVEAGKALFAANCVACHGDDAKGNSELGAPDLTDSFWIYGGDLESIDTTIWGGRQGHMPTWESRLSDLDRKILTLYLLDQRTAKP